MLCCAALVGGVQAACETSLKLKSAEVGGYPVRLWGKILTTGGVPYLVAYSLGKGFMFEGKLDMGEGSKIFYSTDGTTVRAAPGPPCPLPARCSWGAGT